MGVAIYPDHGRSEIELSTHADAAMYEAKEAGGNLVQLARPTEGQTSRDGRQLDFIADGCLPERGRKKAHDLLRKTIEMP